MIHEFEEYNGTVYCFILMIWSQYLVTGFWKVGFVVLGEISYNILGTAKGYSRRRALCIGGDAGGYRG